MVVTLNKKQAEFLLDNMFDDGDIEYIFHTRDREWILHQNLRLGDKKEDQWRPRWYTLYVNNDERANINFDIYFEVLEELLKIK